MVPKHEPITDPSKAIRCKDCVHLKKTPMHDGSIKTHCSGAMMFVEVTPDTFCSWGRMKETENE